MGTLIIPIQLRGDTAANWASVNPVLKIDEPGREQDTGKVKIGDGVTHWNDLGYSIDPTGGGGAVDSVNGQTGVVVLTAASVGAATAAQGATADSAVQPGDLATVATSGAYADLSGKPTLGTAAATAATDYATAAQGAKADTALQAAAIIDSIADADTTHAPSRNAVFDALAIKADLVGGLIPSAQIPAIAITEYLGSVASQAAMLALTGQKGDWALRSDLGTTWIITGNDPTQLADWTQLNYPTAPVTSVNGQTGAVSLSAANVGAPSGSGTSTGTNTGDQTSIVGITGTLAEFNAALTGADFATGGGTATGTNTGDQTSVSGNAGTATALATPRNIDGQAFDGTANITVIAPGTHAASAKATPVDADEFPMVDSAASNVLKKWTWADLKTAMWAAWGALIAAGTGKTTPVDADSFAICDSAASNATKKVTFTNFKAFLKTYLDTLYPPRTIFAVTTSTVSLGNDNAAHAIFPSANDALTVDANTTYFFEAVIRITNGATGHTDSFGFGGTATFTSLGLDCASSRVAAGAVVTSQSRAFLTSASMTVIDVSSTAQGVLAKISGTIRINGAGTIIPQWQFSVDPTGTNQVEPNSYVRMWKVGSDTVASEGAWA